MSEMLDNIITKVSQSFAYLFCFRNNNKNKKALKVRVGELCNTSPGVLVYPCSFYPSENR